MKVLRGRVGDNRLHLAYDFYGVDSCFWRIIQRENSKVAKEVRLMTKKNPRHAISQLTSQ